MTWGRVRTYQEVEEVEAARDVPESDAVDCLPHHLSRQVGQAQDEVCSGHAHRGHHLREGESDEGTFRCDTTPNAEKGRFEATWERMRGFADKGGGILNLRRRYMCLREYGRVSKNDLNFEC